MRNAEFTIVFTLAVPVLMCEKPVPRLERAEQKRHALRLCRRSVPWTRLLKKASFIRITLPDARAA